jgi:hypothetical protein
MLLIPVPHTRSACLADFHKILLISQNAMDEANSRNITFSERGGLNLLRTGKIVISIEQPIAVSGVLNCREFLHQLSHCQPFKTDCAPWS